MKKLRFKPFIRKAKNSITCPKCDGLTRVLDSRATDANEVWRRRICSEGHRFTTVERWMDDHGKVYHGSKEVKKK